MGSLPAVVYLSLRYLRVLKGKTREPKENVARPRGSERPTFGSGTRYGSALR
jgi:hypothetical protein